LIHAPTGDLALTDLSGSVVLDLSSTRPVPEDGAWFCPGMIVLIEGIYEEDGSNNSNLGGVGGVGGQIKGTFICETMAGPPAERRDVTIGTSYNSKLENVHTSVGAGFGWVDFLGIGSEKAIGAQMRGIQRRLLGRNVNGEKERSGRTKIAIIGECSLDVPRSLEAIRAVLANYNASGAANDRPLTIVLMGNFVSTASMAGSSKGGGSIEYKEYFDSLASVLSEFPALLANSIFVFVPGDNDPWASSFSAGAAVAVPREGVPEIFTSRIRRAFASANTDAGRRETEGAGEAIWTSNPARISLFGPLDELVLFRDDITGRLRRNAVTFSKSDAEELENNETTVESQQVDSQLDEGTEPNAAVQEHIPKSAATPRTSNADTATARKLVKTILDQGHLSPFPLSARPVLWDYGSSLTLYPLPTALVLTDAEAPSFAVTYEGCHVMNPGRVIDDFGARKGIAKWVEYDIRQKRGLVKEIRF
jgi:DNA polymerase epsilon subunit 2